MTSIDPLLAHSKLIRNKGIGNRQADPLPRLLGQIIDRAGPPAHIDRATSRPWASALFEGRRHVILLRMEGEDAAARRTRFLQGLGDVQWTLVGHFVADVAVDEVRSTDSGEWIEMSALTIEDW